MHANFVIIVDSVSEAFEGCLPHNVEWFFGGLTNRMDFGWKLFLRGAELSWTLTVRKPKGGSWLGRHRYWWYGRSWFDIWTLPSRPETGDTTAHGLIRGVIRFMSSIEPARRHIFTLAHDTRPTLTNKRADISLISPIIFILRQHQHHLLSILQPLHFLHCSHVLLELLHSLIDFTVIEVVLDGTHHVSHAIESAHNEVYLVLARTNHVFDASVLLAELLLFFGRFGLLEDVFLLKDTVGKLNCLGFDDKIFLTKDVD